MGTEKPYPNARSLQSRLVGLSRDVYPVFAQPFISNARFATETEIEKYMHWMGFKPLADEGCFENNKYLLSDIKPKNVLCTNDGTIFVIDAEIQKKE